MKNSKASFDNINNGSYLRAISFLRNSIEGKNITIASSTPRLFFLCGANKEEGGLSIRRQRLKTFIETNIDNSIVVIAENFFDNYLRNHSQKKDKKNSLDFEFILSHISEKVIIVLESYSSFCELGAFSHRSLRSKLIVINDNTYKNAPSFINTGPIAAITEDFKDERVIWYKMAAGIDNEDGIASIFKNLEATINNSSMQAKKPLDINPITETITIEKALFIHDVIFFYKPGTYAKLIRILKDIFGREKNFDIIRKIMAILTSLNFILYNRKQNKLESCRRTEFLDYGIYGTRIKSGLQLSMLREQMRA